MKLSKEEFKEKIDGYDIPEEIKVEIIEAIEDTLEVPEVNEYEEKYNDLLAKYKARFFEKVEEVAEEVKEEVVEEQDEEEEEEKEVIDIKEI